jgi:hypothetical protein
MVSELAKRLDEQYPGWAEPIDLETLNMGNAARCVIGQGVTGGNRLAYPDALKTLQRDTDHGNIAGYFLTRYDTEWRAEIKARRN